MEAWKDVVGYEGFYQVSNMGNVRSVPRVLLYERNGNTFKRNIPHKIMKPTKTEFGYLIVSLTKEKTKIQGRIHRLVAEAFLPNPENKRCVNHKDGNKENNCVENLEWVTYSENMQHAADSGLWVSWNKGLHPEGRPRSEETRRKISAAKMGNKCHTQKHTEETKRKISEAKKEYYRKKTQ